ncbi:hypothetical protein [uncultured Aquimarina sp.]|uniref:hypothetical protein n=1 Tax=uncultured Aquimarina sp. TaxID=575652 RepID=UPI0026294D41|nr:hypothetical protein [uncultured Aquimarina sp.]
MKPKNIQKHILNALIVLISFVSYGQISEGPPSTDFFPKKVDSIHFSVLDVVVKGMMSSEQKEYEKQLKKVVLYKTDQESLMQLLSLDLSYSNSMALLPHHNLVFKLFKDGTIVTKIKISTLTGNIYIRDEKSEDLFFRNSCSSLFGNYLVGLLSKYPFLELLKDGLLLEGLGH